MDESPPQANIFCPSALLYVTFSALLEEEEMGPITSS
jgi:hypothetical protein